MYLVVYYTLLWILAIVSVCEDEDDCWKEVVQENHLAEKWESPRFPSELVQEKRITLEGSVIRESPWREVGITMMRHHELDRE